MPNRQRVNYNPHQTLKVFPDRHLDCQPQPPPTGNAQTAVIYATFWIEKVSHKHHGHSFMQLQYAQMVTLNFPVRSLLPGVFVNLGWPHVMVGTLRKRFG